MPLKPSFRSDIYSNPKNKTLINKLVVCWLSRWYPHKILCVYRRIEVGGGYPDSSLVPFLHECLVLLFWLSNFKQLRVVKFLQAAEIGNCTNTFFHSIIFHFRKKIHFPAMYGSHCQSTLLLWKPNNITTTELRVWAGADGYKFMHQVLCRTACIFYFT